MSVVCVSLGNDRRGFPYNWVSITHDTFLAFGSQLKNGRNSSQKTFEYRVCFVSKKPTNDSFLLYSLSQDLNLVRPI